MSDVKKAWEDVADSLSALGRKVGEHADLDPADHKEFTSALDQLAGAVTDIFQGLGRATQDPAVRDDARQLVQTFADAINASVADVTDKTKKQI